MDRNSHKTIEGIAMPELPIPQLDNKMCESEVFCGLPLYSCRQLYTGGYWLEGPQPSAINPTTVKLSSKRILADNLVEMNLLLDGSTLTSFLIRPKEAVKLHKWSFTPLIPEPNEWKDKDSYFVMITHGLEGEPLNVTLTFKVKYHTNLITLKLCLYFLF